MPALLITRSRARSPSEGLIFITADILDQCLCHSLTAILCTLIYGTEECWCIVVQQLSVQHRLLQYMYKTIKFMLLNLKIEGLHQSS